MSTWKHGIPAGYGLPKPKGRPGVEEDGVGWSQEGSLGTSACAPEGASRVQGFDGADRPMKPSFLVISQIFVPDPASVGQHVADAAAEMAWRGYRTIVYTSARGYEDPSRRYPASEGHDGVEVRRRLRVVRKSRSC